MLYLNIRLSLSDLVDVMAAIKKTVQYEDIDKAVYDRLNEAIGNAKAETHTIVPDHPVPTTGPINREPSKNGEKWDAHIYKRIDVSSYDDKTEAWAKWATHVWSYRSTITSAAMSLRMYGTLTHIREAIETGYPAGFWCYLAEIFNKMCLYDLKHKEKFDKIHANWSGRALRDQIGYMLLDAPTQENNNE